MSARPDTWMPMYWGDYTRDTGHLNAAGHGAYLMLIKHYWCSGRPLPNDDDELWRIACCDSKREWLKLRQKVERLFVEDGPLLRHKRVDREIAQAAANAGAKAQAGKKGAYRRWKKDSSAIAEPSVRQWQNDATSPSPSPSPSPKEKPPPDGGGKKRGTRLPADFEPDPSVGADQGLTTDETAHEAQQFRDHFTAAPGQKGIRTDWPATWRMWCRNAAKWKAERHAKHAHHQNGHRPPRSAHETLRAAMAAELGLSDAEGRERKPHAAENGAAPRSGEVDQGGWLDLEPGAYRRH